MTMVVFEETCQKLRDLVAAFRIHLEDRGRCGLLGVPKGPAPRFPRSSSGSDEIETWVVSNAPVLAVVGDDGPNDQASSNGPVGAEGLATIREELGDCTRCKLGRERTHLVFGTGNPDAVLAFVGEAPGADEDVQGEPFVGAAGQLLNKMIEAMGFDRSDVFICNVLKCRPPRNRDPEPDEIAACEPFLGQQIAAVRPRVIVALGRFAARVLCPEVTSIMRQRGTLHSYQGIPVMPTYHPSFLLREPPRKREAWADLLQVLAVLKGYGIAPPRAPKG
jgi:uracil-DNA glycosylase